MSSSVSIIISVYNTAPYLDDCIGSVLNQSYHDFELILVNDGSTDGSADILERYAKIDSRIKVISKSNTGQSDSRYIGLQNSSGEYIYFMDSDDTIEPFAINEMVHLIEMGSFDFVCARYRTVNEEGNPIKTQKEYPITTISERINVIEEALSVQNIKASLWIKLFRKDILVKCYSQYVRDTKFNEDFLLTCLVAIQTNKVGLTNVIVYNVKQRDSSISRTIKPDILTSIDPIFQIIWSNIDDYKLNADVESAFYYGYMKFMAFANILASSLAKSYFEYKEIYDMLSKDTIFHNRSAFRLKRSYSFLNVTYQLCHSPRLFYFLSRLLRPAFKF